MDMCRGSIIRKVISFSIPLMLTGILQLFYNAADIIVVGQFSGKEAPSSAVKPLGRGRHWPLGAAQYSA